MTVKELHHLFLKELTSVLEKREASNITTMIFEHFARIDRAKLIREPETILLKPTVDLILNSLSELKQHKPVQYILGETWFYKLKIKVSASVLIPRPETEELVDAAIDYLKQIHNKKVIDIGTGSGCIAIAIKKNEPLAEITAVDVSNNAILIAKENAADHDAEIDFNCFDFLHAGNWNGLKRYDVIISNPPYIPENEMGLLNKNVTDYEPHLALFVKERMIFYSTIATFGESHLNIGGRIFMEVHEDFAQEVCNIFNSEIYNAEIQTDLFGKQRMVFAIRYR